MRPRMLCTNCRVTDHPSTVLEGSDRLEMLAWLCLVIPGWLYCAWRHALRAKVCSLCGGASLVREARRAAARRGSDPTGAVPSITNLHGPVRWPRALAAPRARLRKGAVGALIVKAAFAAWLLAAFHPTSLPATLAAETLTMLAVCWLLHALGVVVWLRLRTPTCRAWRADGSPLQIEIL